MTKVEEFIQQNTKDSTNKSLKKGEYYLWLTPREARKAVEIEREEIYDWLEENASSYIEKQDTMFGTIKVYNSHKLVNDLKQAMK